MTEYISAGPVLSMMTAEERLAYERERAELEARRPRPEAGSWTSFGDVDVYGPKWFAAWGRSDGTWHYDTTDGGLRLEIGCDEYVASEDLSKEQAIALARWILGQYPDDPS